MFNTARKKAFIKQYTQSLITGDLVKRLFNRIEPFEKAWKDDIATRSVEELAPVMDEILGLRKSGWGLTLSILREYARWYSQNYRGGTDSLLKIEPDGLTKVKKQTVANPLQLHNYFEAIFNPVEMNTVDNTGRCYFWMAYAGLKEEEALSITNKCVDFETMTIHLNLNQYPIYREAIPVFRNVVNSTAFDFYHPLQKDVKPRLRTEGNSIVRGFKALGNAKGFGELIRRNSITAQQKNKTDMSLSFQRIWLSGVYYRMAEQERAGLSPDFLWLAMQTSKDINTSQFHLSQSARTYLEDFERWKLAHSI